MKKILIVCTLAIVGLGISGCGQIYDAEPVSIGYDNNELKYEGDYLNGTRNGKGIEYENGKLSFVGEFFNGNRWNGKEIIFSEDDEGDDTLFEVEFFNGKRK